MIFQLHTLSSRTQLYDISIEARQKIFSIVKGGGCWHVSMHTLTAEISINLILSKAKISIEFMMEKMFAMGNLSVVRQ